MKPTNCQNKSVVPLPAALQSADTPLAPDLGQPKAPCTPPCPTALDSQQELTAVQQILVLMLHYGRDLLRSGEMKPLFGNSRDLFLDCKAAGWIRPTVDGNRRTVYHISDIVACLRRIHAEGPPPPAPKRPKVEGQSRPASKSKRGNSHERS